MEWPGAGVRDRKALHDLERLIAHPGTEINVLDLVGGGEVAEVRDAQLDETAAFTYRRRVSELDAALDEADLRGDAERSWALSDEKQALLDQLGAAFGFSGRPRRASGAGG